MKCGTEKADAVGRRCYLESTPVAHVLYRKHGWVDVDEIVLGLEKYGKKDHRVMIMMREPEIETHS